MLEATESLLPKPRSRGAPVRAYCVGFQPASLEELDRLLGTLGVVSAGRLLCAERKISPATYVGSGKLEELSATLWGGEFPAERDRASHPTAADCVVIDTELSPNQLRNVEKILGLPVLDRPGVIIEIFSQNARSKEAKTQVELARLQYLLPRLAHFWTHFERQRGGTNQKGMGEKQLEVDRRLVKKRMQILRGRLSEIASERSLRRGAREDLFKVAMVGYTNAGKSTLLNALTHSQVLAQDKLFATLDPSIRALDPSSHPPVVLIDTVGFIRNLPTFLIASFKSTLEEIRDASLLVHVVDASSDEAAQEIRVTQQVLKDLELDQQPRLVVLNKADRLSGVGALNLARSLSPGATLLSAHDAAQVLTLRDKILARALQGFESWELVLPYAESKLEAKLHELATIEHKRHLETGTFYRIRIDPVIAQKLGLKRFTTAKHPRGRRIGARSLQWLLVPLLGPLVAALFTQVALGGRSARADEEPRSSWTELREPLTNALAQAWDPMLKDPALRAWAVRRSWRLPELQVIRVRDRYRLSARRVVATGEYAVRSVWAWQGCSEPERLQAAARTEARVAIAELEQLARSRASELLTALGRIEGDTEAAAAAAGAERLAQWIERVEVAWRARLGGVRYGDTRCRGRLREWLEPPGRVASGASSEELGGARPWVRAPAQWIRWQSAGRTSLAWVIRVGVRIGQTLVVGRVALDPSLERTSLDPGFLAAQGVPVRRIERAPVADQIEIGGQPIAEQVPFALSTSWLARSPEYAEACCDGVLGADVLRAWAIELLPPHDDDPLTRGAVRFYAGAGYGYRPEPEWRLGATWEPLVSALPRGMSGTGSDVTILSPRWVERAAFGVGRSVIDLTNGRLWWPVPELAPESRRRGVGTVELLRRSQASGVVMRFGGEREGRRAGARSRTRVLTLVHNLGRAGLGQWLRRELISEGTRIESLQGVPVGKLDQWQVERCLGESRIKIAWRAVNPDRTWLLKQAEYVQLE